MFSLERHISTVYPRIGTWRAFCYSLLAALLAGSLFNGPWFFAMCGGQYVYLDSAKASKGPCRACDGYICLDINPLQSKSALSFDFPSRSIANWLSVWPLLKKGNDGYSSTYRAGCPTHISMAAVHCACTSDPSTAKVT